jgi:ribosomal protein S18 acetylase RimI-like enzyme
MSNDSLFRLVRPDAQQALTGIQFLVGGYPELANGFLDYARQQNLDLTRQVLALSGDTIISMCLWVASPGKTALLFTPRLEKSSPHFQQATAATIAAALAEARDAGITLVQAMVEPADTKAADLFSSAGLQALARLVYMERRPPSRPPVVDLPRSITLEPYSAQTHELFKDAITASYHQTLDCPALSGLRDVDDVLLGHKGVGHFDPQLWSVVIEHDRAIGCLLLAEIPTRSALELVYLGLSPEARGRGLGRTLMNRVLAIGSRRQFDNLTLAVDSINSPALALYRRCGYRKVAERIAMIKKL